MGIFFTNIQKEVMPKVKYEAYEDYEGLEIIKSKEKTIINRNSEGFYLDLKSFANELKINEKELLELIGYSSAVQTYLAYYRDKQYKVVRVMDIRGLEDLTRLLKGLGTDLELLKGIKQKVNKMVERIEEKESKEFGEN
jgi:hypothetical protein